MAMGTTARNNQTVNDKLADHEKRITALEELTQTLTNIDETLTRIFRYVKWSAPSIISAAVAAGFVNGKLGAFLHALTTGVAT